MCRLVAQAQRVEDVEFGVVFGDDGLGGGAVGGVGVLRVPSQGLLLLDVVGEVAEGLEEAVSGAVGGEKVR